ncbi:MAG: hypothetical protein KGM18_06030 [Sphingomonadales bacterium]|nr:hypothetical protein [Sphingomonadales bacterium]
MLIRPELAALRSDDAAQRRAQAAMGAALARWRATPIVAAADAELAQWGSGAELDDLSLLSALFSGDHDAAPRFCTELVAVILAELARDPLGQSPLRHYCDDAVASITLLRHGTTVLSLQAIDGSGLARAAPPQSARFAPCETWEAVLAGSARAERLAIAGPCPGGVAIERSRIAIRPGLALHRIGLAETLHLDDVPSSLVLLRMQRRTGCSAVTSEYALDDGALLHQAASSPRDSRLELTAALLGRMGREDAAPLLAAMAEERGNPSLRWQVLRECLALDTATGFATLCRIAGDGNDPLAAHAGALRDQLIETYPQLAGASRCPA